MALLVASRHAAILTAALSLSFASSLVGPAAAQRGMSDRQIMQMLGPMMNDADFNDKLEDFANEYGLDPNLLRAMIARQKARGMSKQQLRQQQQMQGEKPDDD